MVLLLVVEEDAPAPYDAETTGAEVEESSGVFRAMPRRSLAKCGDVRELVEQVRRVAR